MTIDGLKVCVHCTVTVYIANEVLCCVCRQKDIENTKTADRARRQMDLEELKTEMSALKDHKSSHMEVRGQLEHSLEENRRQNVDKR